MKKFILLFLVSLFYSGSALAGDCDTTVTGTENNQLSCSDNDTLTVTGTISYDGENAVLGNLIGDLTVINSGTIETTASSGNHSAVKGQSSLNLTVTNSGTITAGTDYGINIISAEKVTITNEAGGVIQATPGSSGSQYAIGGTKQGNCNAFKCQDGSTSSSTGEGLTLRNYGTIDAHSRTVYGGHASSHTSKKTKIYNYDGGMIDSTSSATIKYNYAEDFELYNYSGATIQSGSGDFAVDLKGASTITIDNAGTIKSGARYGISCQLCSGLTLTNSGTLEATTNSALFLDDITGTNTITNSGTIINGSGNTPVTMQDAAGITLTNSGTISSAGQYGINADNAFSPTITNSGTISASSSSSSGIGINLAQNQTDNLATGATITNSGTINALGDLADGIRLGDTTGVYNDATITNSGTIAGGDNSIWINGSGTTGTNIITKGEATYTGEIEMESAVVEMTLDCSIKKDMDIEIHGKTNMTVTNNLCGNDTYEILDSSKNADADNSETNGYLRILGEDLEIDDENAKYRSENVLTKLRGLFDAANYINWHAPEDKFFKIFHSTQKRDGAYKGEMSGVVGQLSPFILGGIRNNIFLGYTRQDGNFDNGEFLGGDNFALGLKSVYENNGFKASFTPMIGLNDLTVTDFDTDTKTKVSTNLLSGFAGFNTKLGKEIKTSEDASLNLSVQSTFGLQRFPEYLSKFSDGDLSVDEAVEQVLGAGFEVSYMEGVGKGFIIKPYIGANVNNNLNNSIKIKADGENKNVSPAQDSTSGYYAGVSFTKASKDLNFDLDLMYGNEDGLINQIAAVSLTKTFGKSKEKDPKIKASEDTELLKFNQKDLLEFGELKELTEKLKLKNEELKTENEKLKTLSAKLLEENKTSKRLIVELIKENEKIKLEKEIFKNNALENENQKLIEEIEKGITKNQNKYPESLIFIATLLLISTIMVSLVARR